MLSSDFAILHNVSDAELFLQPQLIRQREQNLSLVLHTRCSMPNSFFSLSSYVKENKTCLLYYIRGARCPTLSSASAHTSKRTELVSCTTSEVLDARLFLQLQLIRQRKQNLSLVLHPRRSMPNSFFSFSSYVKENRTYLLYYIRGARCSTLSSPSKLTLKTTVSIITVIKWPSSLRFPQGRTTMSLSSFREPILIKFVTPCTFTF